MNLNAGNNISLPVDLHCAHQFLYGSFWMQEKYVLTVLYKETTPVYVMKYTITGEFKQVIGLDFPQL